MNQGIPTGGLNMNTQWKSGYEEGFAAGWKAARKDTATFPVAVSPYYNGMHATMANQPYSVTLGVQYDTITINQPKKPKKADLRVIRNLTDHTEIV